MKDVKQAVVIVNNSLQNAGILSLIKPYYKIRLSGSTLEGSCIFPASGVAFLIQSLDGATQPSADGHCTSLRDDVLNRIEKLLAVHRSCYLICLSPTNGLKERNTLTALQHRFLRSKLHLLPVDSHQQAVECMLTVAKVTTKSVSKLLQERVAAIVERQMTDELLMGSLQTVNVSQRQRQLLHDGLGSIRQVACASGDQLLNCSVDSETVSAVEAFFGVNGIP